jgi:DNA repair protein RadC
VFTNSKAYRSGGAFTGSIGNRPRNRVLPRCPATTPRCLSNERWCRDIASRSRNVCCGCSTNLHNHPSGDPKPSCDDIEMAREIAKAAEALGISIRDHLVIGRKGHASFRSLGLL